jgi:DNA-binding transcriptional MerR regulator
VLRFWETRFPQIRPLKRAGGRRYYRPDDIERLRVIKRLLYEEGYTIKGVQKLFKEQGAQALTSGAFEPRSLFERLDIGEPANETDDAIAGPAVQAVRDEERPDAPRAPGLRLPAAELAALRNILAEIDEAKRILTQARSQEA